MRPLTTNLDDEGHRPYFLWDEDVSVRELKDKIAAAEAGERARLLGKVMREARDPDVWRFTTLDEVRALWPGIVRHLGRRRAFWEYLLSVWR